MRPWIVLLAVAAGATGAGCAKDHVAFVTSSSFGVNLDTMPATVSLAYDRTEGYIAPRYQNGGLPPVLASIRTDGAVIAPKIKQLYATGAAAVIAAGGTASGPTTLSGEKRQAFIGTTTTLGLKAAFGAQGPESLSLGYKRKEFSYIPLGVKAGADGVQEDVYPSAIASYDTTLATPSPANVSLKTLQFIATGQAAEAIAAQTRVQDAFAAMAADAVAEAAGKTQAVEQLSRIDAIIAFLSPGGAFSAAGLPALVDKANGLKTGSVPQYLKQQTTADAVRGVLDANQVATTSLAAAIKAS